MLKEIVREGWTTLLRAVPPKVSLELGGVSFRSKPRPVDCIVIRAEEEVETPAPACLIGTPATEAPRRYTAPTEFVARIAGGYISKLTGVTDRDGYRLAGVSCLTPHQLGELERYRAPLSWVRPRLLDGVTLALSTGQESNYFHWLLEVVCRFGLAESLGEPFDRVYVEDRYPFQRDSLERLGIPPSRIVSSHQHPIVRCEQVLASSCLEAFWTPRDWMVDYLRARFWTCEVSDQRRRLYISRERSRFRRTRNEAPVTRLLAAHGFEKVVLEELDFGEQIALFRSAAAVVGTHGAGLVNLVFAKPGTKVIEIMPPRYCHWVYHHLAARAGCEYRCVMGEGATDPSSWEHQKEDIEVDVAKLDEALGSAGL